MGGIPDPRTPALLDEVLAQPGIPPSWRTPDFRAAAPPVPIEFVKDGVAVSYFSRANTQGCGRKVHVCGTQRPHPHPYATSPART